MAQMQGEIKRNVASLVGGIAVAVVVFVLWVLLSGDLGFSGPASIVLGLLVASAVGGYVRLADL